MPKDLAFELAEELLQIAERFDTSDAKHASYRPVQNNDPRYYEKLHDMADKLRPYLKAP